MKINILEKKLKIKILKNKIVLGIDTASRTGWCLLTTNNETLYKDMGFINIKTKNKYFKYNEIIDIFSNLIKPEYDIIIEDTFFRFNPAMFRMISRIGAIAYTIAHLKGCKNVEYMPAVTARKNLGLPSNKKKKEVHEAFIKIMKSKVTDEDIIDAEILALNGLVNKRGKIKK